MGRIKRGKRGKMGKGGNRDQEGGWQDRVGRRSPARLSTSRQARASDSTTYLTIHFQRVGSCAL